MGECTESRLLAAGVSICRRERELESIIAKRIIIMARQRQIYMPTSAAFSFLAMGLAYHSRLIPSWLEAAECGRVELGWVKAER